MKLLHVGIAVESLEAARPVFEKLLGAPPISTEAVAEQKVRVTLFAAGESRVELLEGTEPESPIRRFLEKRGPGVHHLAFSVQNIERTLRELQEAGFRAIDESPGSGADGCKVAFLHPKSTAGVLIELVQEESR